jgi:hypothetical protein
METSVSPLKSRFLTTASKRFIVPIKRRAATYPHLAMAVVLLTTFIIFWPLMIHFYAVDDFSWLLYGGQGMDSLTAWFHAFTHINGSGQYRPLTLNVFFWLGYHVFGLDPLGMHLINFITFLGACWLVYRLSLQFTTSKIIAASASTLFCFSTVHFVHLYWISGFTETFATLCIAGALYATTQVRNYQVIAWYIIGLASNETTVILPVLLVAYYYVYKRYSIKQTIMASWTIWSILIAYMLLRLLAFGGLGAKGAFTAVWSPSIWGQEVIREFKSSFGVNAYMDNVLSSSKLLHSLVIIIFVGIIAAIVYGISRKSVAKPEWRIIVLGVIWFVVGLLPVLPFANNFADYTTSISTIGLAIILIGLLRDDPRQRFVYVLIAVGALLLSLISMYGPGGEYHDDGYRSLSRADYSAFIQMQATYNRTNQPLYVSIVGTDSQRGMSGLTEMSKLINKNSQVVAGYSPKANLTLTFDDRNFVFYVVQPQPTK